MTIRAGILLVAVIAVSGCTFKFPGLDVLRGKGRQVAVQACDPALEAGCVTVLTPDDDTVRPRPRGVVAPDAPPSADEVALGETIGALGDVTETGMWLRTPLVKVAGPGRIVWRDNGNSVAVELIPLAGAPGAGSQLSLAAMQALGIPLTGLPRLMVFRR